MGGFGMVKVMTGLVVSTDTMQARQTKSGKRAMRAVAVAEPQQRVYLYVAIDEANVAQRQHRLLLHHRIFRVYIHGL